MDSALVAKAPKNRVARNAKDHFAKPSEIGQARFHRLDLQPQRLRVARIHAKKIRCEQRRLRAPRAGPNFHDRIAVLIRFGRQQGDLHRPLEPRQLGLDPQNFLASHLGKFLVSRVSQLAILSQLPPGLGKCFPLREQILRCPVLPQNLAGMRGIIEKSG